MKNLPGTNSTRSSEDQISGRGVLNLGWRKSFLIRCFEIVSYCLVRGTATFSEPTRTMSPEEVRKILVVEYWQLGDIVILLPFLRSLRQNYPQATISLVINPKSIPIIENQGLVDELISCRVPWAQHFSRWRKYNPFSLLWFDLIRLIGRLRKSRFDLALSGRMDVRDNFLLWLTGAKQRVGYGVGGGGFFLTSVAHPDFSRPHRSQLWIGLLEHLGRIKVSPESKLRLDESQLRFTAAFLDAEGINSTDFVLGIHPGARIVTRQWGNQNFQAVGERLANEFDAKVLWFCDPNEAPPTLPPGFIPVSRSLKEFMGVLARCNVLLCNDGGPMHIGTALGVSVVAVFGPTQPEWFGPLGDNNRLVIRPEFQCRPCFDYCVFDKPYCLREISVDQVYEIARESVQSSRFRQGTLSLS